MVFEILLGLWGVDKIVKDAQRRERATARAQAVVYREAELFIGFNETLGWEKFVLKKPLFGSPHWRVRPSMRRAQSPENEIGAVAAQWLKSQPSDVIDEIRETTQAELDRSLPWEMLSSKKWAGLFYALNRKAGFPKFYWARHGFFGHKQWRVRAYCPYPSA